MATSQVYNPHRLTVQESLNQHLGKVIRVTPTVSGTYEPTSGWNSYQPNNTQVSLYVATADSVQANNYVRELRLDSEL